MITTSVDKGGDRYTKSSLASSTIALIVCRANLHYSLREGYANDSAQCSSETATFANRMEYQVLILWGRSRVAGFRVDRIPKTLHPVTADVLKGLDLGWTELLAVASNTSGGDPIAVALTRPPGAVAIG